MMSSASRFPRQESTLFRHSYTRRNPVHWTCLDHRRIALESLCPPERRTTNALSLLKAVRNVVDVAVDQATIVPQSFGPIMSTLPFPCISSARRAHPRVERPEPSSPSHNLLLDAWELRYFVTASCWRKTEGRPFEYKPVILAAGAVVTWRSFPNELAGKPGRGPSDEKLTKSSGCRRFEIHRLSLSVVPYDVDVWKALWWAAHVSPWKTDSTQPFRARLHGLRRLLAECSVP
ncbi:hypothetical protein C8F01DRAFT_192719 [Mycena amicta]|nr:hypothetical protein C8F01DRAFT_192719 [Mycena amicta]